MFRTLRSSKECIVNTDLKQFFKGQIYRINLSTIAEQVRVCRGGVETSLLDEIDIIWNRVNSLQRVNTGVVSVVRDMKELNGIQHPEIGSLVWVIEGESGNSEQYIYTFGGWAKLNDTTTLEVLLNWKDIEDRPQASATDIDEAVELRHDHDNMQILELLSADDGQLMFNEEYINRVYYTYDNPLETVEGREVNLNIPDGSVVFHLETDNSLIEPFLYLDGQFISLDKHKADIEALKALIEGHQAELLDLHTKYTGLFDKSVIQGLDIDRLGNKISAVETSVSEINSTLDSFPDEIADKTVMEQMFADQRELIDQNRTDIDRNAGDISRLTSEAEQTRESVEENASKITELGSRADTIQQMAERAGSTASEALGAANVNTTLISSIDSRVDANAGAITDLQTAIPSLSDRIDAVDLKFSTDNGTILREIRRVETSLTNETGRIESELTRNINRVGSHLTSEATRLDNRIDDLSNHVAQEVSRVEHDTDLEVNRLERVISEQGRTLNDTISTTVDTAKQTIYETVNRELDDNDQEIASLRRVIETYDLRIHKSEQQVELLNNKVTGIESGGATAGDLASVQNVADKAFQKTQANADRIDNLQGILNTTQSNLNTQGNKVDKTVSDLSAHIGNFNNPHRVTKSHVGLGNLPDAKSDSVNLDDSNTLATSKAVKAVSDSLKAFTSGAGAGSLADISAKINEAVNRAEEARQAARNASQKAETAQTGVNSLNAKTDALQGNLGALEGSLDDFEDAIGQLDSNISSVENDISRIRTDLEILSGREGSTADSISQISGTLSTLQNQMNALQVTVDNSTSGSGEVTQMAIDAKSSATAAMNAAEQAIETANKALTDAVLVRNAQTVAGVKTFSSSPLVPTVTQGDRSKKVVNTEYLAVALANLVNAAPGLLDTLGELANAIGNDPNFAATVATMVGEVAAALKAHTDRTDNPHSVTKAQVGLGNLPNAKSDAVNVSNSNQLATSTAVKTVQDNLTTHTSRTNNPHSVTKAQVGLGNIPNAISDSVSTDSSTTLATSKAVKTLNDSTVKLTGNQSIAGTKTFTSNIVIDASYAGIYCKHNDVIKGTLPSASNYAEIIWKDQTWSGNEANLGIAGTAVYTDGMTDTFLRAYKFQSGSAAHATIGVRYLVDGTYYAYGPATPGGATGTQLATAAFVNSKITAGTSASATKVSHNVSSTNATYPLLMSGTANATSNQNTTPLFGTGIKANPSTSTITATTFSGALSGNASSATKLQTARTIGGVSFNGTANINLPGVNTQGNQNTTGNAATATKLQTARTIGGVSFDGTANINLPGVNTTGNQDTTGNAATATLAKATAAVDTTVTGLHLIMASNDYFKINVGGAKDAGWVELASGDNGIEPIYVRQYNNSGAVQNSATLLDGSGNTVFPKTVTATTFSGALSGNASSATKLQTARNIGGVAFDGTANINLPGVNTAGNQNTSGNAASATKLQTARTIGGVSFDGTANINLPGVNIAGSQNTTGNAASATKLQTARNIGGVSFDGTANINLPGVNTQGNQNTTGNAATATKLQTARTIGGVSFDGTANINLPGVNTAGNQNTSGNAATASRVSASVGAGATGEALRINMTDANDYFRIAMGSTGTNAGWVELATADDGNEPIYVRQYNGAFTMLTRTATLLDGSGNSSFPGTVTAPTFSGALSGNATTATTLQTARSIRTNLASTSAVNFNGSANITPGVTGTLPIANGGTGATAVTGSSGAVKNLFPNAITTDPGHWAVLTAGYANTGYITTHNARTVLTNGCVHTSGNETVAGVKTFSSPLTSSVVSSTYLNGAKGTAIINSTAAKGGYVMLARMNSTNGYFTMGSYQDKFLLHYTAQSIVDAGTNSYTRQVKILDEAGNTSFPGIVTASGGFSGNASSATKLGSANVGNSTTPIYLSGGSPVACSNLANTTVSATITTTWTGSAAPYTQNITVTGVTATSNVFVAVSSTASQAQVEAYQKLNWTDGGQAANRITLKAWGEKNTVSIPINISFGV